MKFINGKLDQLERLVREGTYAQVEYENLEIKDLPTGENWKELYKSVCAFLNGSGGIIILGIKERNKSYHHTGFELSPSTEEKIKGLPTSFTDEKGSALDLSEYIRPDLFETRKFLDGQVGVLYVEKLPEDKKFVFYKREAYQRRLTGDHRLKSHEIERQADLRAEIATARELEIVGGASLADLDVDKLNDYIQRLNQGMKVETLKADISAALPFLERKKFVIKQHPTLLGVLVCGLNPYELIGGRCQVDGFVESQAHIASNKKVLKDNIIQLLEQSVNFVFTNIQTGISIERGGSPLFEYPERLIRETINNALAHRDYSIDKFVNVTIKPNESIEIRNPGKFREEQVLRIDKGVQIRRIIPLPIPQNPKLADVLKTFDRWEGKGWGMSSLTNVALDNQIDLPYYRLFAERDIGLSIPKGKVLDEKSLSWLKSFSGHTYRKTGGRELTEEQKTVLVYFFKSERLNREEKYTIALTPDNNHFQTIAQLEDWGLVFKHPESPSLYPTYLVDREMVRNDFFQELREIFAGSFDLLGSDYKEVLNAIYHLNQYGLYKKDINASQVGDFLWFQSQGEIRDVIVYNDYKRRIRYIINRLASKEFINKEGGGRPSYSINLGKSGSRTLFDT